MQKIKPFLWFNDNAEEAVDFYVSVFRDAKKGVVARYGDEGPGPRGKAMTVTFELFGTSFVALNGGPHFSFNEAVSFVIDCNDQDEIDYYWNKLSEDGQPSRCGWVKDRFGLWWQVVPTELSRLFTGPAENSSRAMTAMMGMQKLEIGKLQAAYEGL